MREEGSRTQLYRPDGVISRAIGLAAARPQSRDAGTDALSLCTSFRIGPHVA